MEGEELQRLRAVFADRLARSQQGTHPTDRSAAEEGVAVAYRSAGYSPPRSIIWCDSPLAIERSRKLAWARLAPGKVIKEEVVDTAILRAWRNLHELAPARQIRAVQEGIAIHARAAGSFAPLNVALDQQSAGVAWTFKVMLGTLRQRLGNWVAWRRTAKYVPFRDSRWLPHDSIGILSVDAYLNELGGIGREQTAMRGLQAVALNAGAMVAHERVCWLSERPVQLLLNERGDLHNPKGPAVRYADGWSMFAWKGVVVVPWIIEHPERIDERVIALEHNPLVRRCLIDIMTPAKYVASGAVKRAAVDRVGTLWRKRWFDSDLWAAVEVVNGSPEPDGTFKHYFLQVPPEMTSPLEAVAWTYGMTPERYLQLVRRT